jgi:hypothetical protein
MNYKIVVLTCIWSSFVSASENVQQGAALVANNAQNLQSNQQGEVRRVSMFGESVVSSDGSVRSGDNSPHLMPGDGLDNAEASSLITSALTMPSRIPVQSFADDAVVANNSDALTREEIIRFLEHQGEVNKRIRECLVRGKENIEAILKSLRNKQSEEEKK